MTTDFFQNIMLLVLTAVLTGLVTPYILRRIDEQRERKQREADHRKMREQTLFEADLARQAKIIDAQAQLLEALSLLLWGFILACAEVAYYVVHQDRARYTSAAAKYDEQSWAFFFKVRAEISKARRLVSSTTYQELRDFYYGELIQLDDAISGLIERPGYTESEAEREPWQAMLESFGTTWADRIDYFVNLLATEFDLAAPDLRLSSERLQAPKHG